MVSADRIRKEMGHTLNQTAFKNLGQFEQGKVRDSYKLPGRRVLVTTDRISAFDRVLGTIPFKGQVLNQIAAFWFEKTQDIAPNHIIAIPDPNVMVVAECDQIPLEFIVRGYITGVTKTSAWYNYQKGVRNFCGNALPEGLKKDQKFDRPILTPTTKLEEHDRSISPDEAIAEGLIDRSLFDAAANICFRLFERGTEYAASRGLILVDTKYEIGRLGGKLVVTDEVHTPDSSRYWYSDTYQKLFLAGEDQRKLDKEFVREWLADKGFRGDGEPPKLTEDVVIEASRRYIQAYEQVTGQEFIVHDEPIAQRMSRSLSKYFGHTVA